MNKKIGHSRQEQRMLKENLHGARAAYGKQILVTVSRELTAEYGRGFSYAELACMVQFPQFFPEESIVVTPLQQLSWSHFHALLPIKDSLARDFYQQPLCKLEEITADIFAIEQEPEGSNSQGILVCSPGMYPEVQSNKSARDSQLIKRCLSQGDI